MLRKVKGFEHFDERRHVLKCLVPGTGTGDAPRAFSMKLAEVTRKSANFVSTTIDPELEVSHDEHGRIQAAMAKNVDDLKITAKRKFVKGS